MAPAQPYGYNHRATLTVAWYRPASLQLFAVQYWGWSRRKNPTQNLIWTIPDTGLSVRVTANQ